MKQKERIEKFLQNSLNSNLSSDAQSIVLGTQESVDTKTNPFNCINKDVESCQHNIKGCMNDFGVCSSTTNIEGCYTPPDLSNIIAIACEDF